MLVKDPRTYAIWQMFHTNKRIQLPISELWIEIMVIKIVDFHKLICYLE